MEGLILSLPRPSKLFSLKSSYPFLPPLPRSDLRQPGFVLNLSFKRDPTRFRPLSLSNSYSDPPIFTPSHPPPSYSTLLKAITIGKVALLSSLALALTNPTFPPPAFAGGAIGRGLLRTEILTSAWTGFFSGCLHTLSGPDHLAALAPLSIGRTRMESAAVGALWGCGHDAGQLIFGLLFLLLKDRLHIEVLRTWGTRVVGLTLLIIGVTGITEGSEVPTPSITLETPKKKKKTGFATFATGIVHGLQPDALIVVLPALALPSRLAGGAFLVGTVVAMGGYTVFIGSCSQALKDRVPSITEKLTWASSLLAIGLGFAIILSQFFGFSLY